MTLKFLLSLPALLLACAAALADGLTLQHASYMDTRDLFAAYNDDFVRHYQGGGGQVQVDMSHGSTIRQRRRVLSGELRPVLISMPHRFELDLMAAQGVVSGSWDVELPASASPMATPVVFMVRRGNPLGIRSWDDLCGSGEAELIVADPATSGLGRYTYLTQYVLARQQGGDDAAVRARLLRFYARTGRLFPSSRAAVREFVERRRGDILIIWENTALGLLSDPEVAAGFELVVPGSTLMCQPRIAVSASAAGGEDALRAARAYAARLFSPEGQQLIARHHFRPRDPRVALEHAGRFAPVEQPDLTLIGPIGEFVATHFDEGGWFYEIWREANSE